MYIYSVENEGNLILLLSIWRFIATTLLGTDTFRESPDGVSRVLKIGSPVWTDGYRTEIFRDEKLGFSLVLCCLFVVFSMSKLENLFERANTWTQPHKLPHFISIVSPEGKRYIHFINICHPPPHPSTAMIQC